MCGHPPVTPVRGHSKACRGGGMQNDVFQGRGGGSLLGKRGGFFQGRGERVYLSCIASTPHYAAAPTLQAQRVSQQHHLQHPIQGLPLPRAQAARRVGLWTLSTQLAGGGGAV